MVLPPKENSLLETVVEAMSIEGYDGLGTALQLIINSAMLLEREKHLQAKPYERTDERQGYASGFKSRSLKTRMGDLDLQVPQTRDGFYPSCLDKGIRSERALKTALAEMYVQGVSTRKVAAITEKLCGFDISSAQVSRTAKELDEHLNIWRTRCLGEYRYLWLDARYEKVRYNNRVVDCAVLIAMGSDANGDREILGVSVKLSEAEVHWREFLQSLVSRGLAGVELIISDDHSGLRAARRNVFPSIPWQRCQFHLQQNAQSYIHSKKERSEIGETIRNIFNAPSLEDAKTLLDKAVLNYEEKNPELSKWLEHNIPEGLTVFTVAPVKRWKKLRTDNPLERVNREVKRRTRTVGIFPNIDSCLRLVTAILIEMSEDWVGGGKRFINMDVEEE